MEGELEVFMVSFNQTEKQRNKETEFLEEKKTMRRRERVEALKKILGQRIIALIPCGTRKMSLLILQS